MKPNVFLRKKGLNWQFRLKGSEFNGNLLDLLNDYKEALTDQLPIHDVVGSLPSRDEMNFSLETLVAEKLKGKTPIEKITFKFGFRTCFFWLENKLKK